MYPKEIEIPVPWGIIAGKAWGDPKDQHVITIHGYQDNANSFDKLIPLLPECFYYICIDLPGHGKSSHIPTLTFVSFMDFMFTIRLVVEHYNKKQYILLGHSYGAQLELLFTQMYPAYVSKLIMLDATYFLPLGPERMVPEYREIMERNIKFMKNNKTAPTYTMDEAVQRMRDARFSHINKEAAEILMKRSLKPAGDGKYYITTGQTLKFIVRPPITVSYDAELLKLHPITCPNLIIIAEDSKIIKKVSKPLLKVFEKNKKFVFQMVPGNHDVHLENPEVVAGIVSKFLLKNENSKL